jgi:glycosyltransferase involved in cell wall biosynthesis
MQEGVPDIRKNPHSGPANHVSHVFEALKSRGHQLRLLAVFDNRIWISEDLETYKEIPVRWLSHGSIRLIERVFRRIQSILHLPYCALFDSLRFALACRQELDGFDLFYERMGWMGYGGTLAAKLLKIPLVLEVNGDYLDEVEQLGIAPHGFQRWLEIKIMQHCIDRVSHVIASGDGWRDRFIHRWNQDPQKVTTIENGSEVMSLVNRDQLRAFQTQGIDAEITVIYLGGFQPWQGVDILIKAFAHSVSSGVRINLKLIGSGSNISEYKVLAQELGISEFVSFLGQMPPKQYGPLLGQADIGVAPYCGRVEFSGLKIIDYKAAGLAIIASGQNGQPAVLTHEETGWIIPPCDEDALYQAIVLLSSDIELRKRIGRAARIEAENNHRWCHTTERLEQLFNRVVDNNHT